MARRRSGASAQAAQTRRAKVDALRTNQQRADRRRRILLIGAVALLAAVALLTTVVFTRDHSTPAASRPPPPAGTGLPPWPAPDDPHPGMEAAGLASNSMEGAVQHFHAHLDILIDGQAVPVPANLGIDAQRRLIAELHTHDESGILHVESASESLTFTLGQLFVEWGVKLDAQDIGGLQAHNGKQLRCYVNGQLIEGDPSQIRLGNHQEIAIAYGADEAAEVPSSYDFASKGF